MGLTTHESLTVTGTAGGLTLATVRAAGEDHAVITVETATIRFAVDGTTATATVGHVASPGDVITLDSSAELTNFSAIRTTGTSATLKVSAGIGRINRG